MQKVKLYGRWPPTPSLRQPRNVSRHIEAVQEASPPFLRIAMKNKSEWQMDLQTRETSRVRSHPEGHSARGAARGFKGSPLRTGVVMLPRKNSAC